MLGQFDFCNVAPKFLTATRGAQHRIANDRNGPDITLFVRGDEGPECGRMRSLVKYAFCVFAVSRAYV
jgi:hypothetical protein